MKEVMVGNPRIRLSYAGEGDLVLFLHGVGGNRSNWRDQIPVFAKHFLAVAWDMRGYADSDDYQGPLRFSDVCQDILKVMRHFKSDAVHLVGLSMGGRIAFDFLHRQPEAVRSLTVCSASHKASQMTPERRSKFLESRLEPLRAGKTPADIASGVARSLLGPHASQSAYESLVGSLSSLRADGYIKALETLSEYEGEINLETINVPVHVVAAMDDPLIPVALLRTMANNIPNCRLTEIPDCGHLSNIERPLAFNEAVLDFLFGVSCRRASFDTGAASQL